MHIYEEKTNYYGRNMGTSHAVEDDIYLFHVRGEETPPDWQSLKLIIDKKNGDREKVLSFKPKWETKIYNTLQKLFLIDTGEAWRIIDVGPLEDYLIRG